MKYLFIITCLLNTAILPIKHYEFCDTCKHWHVDGIYEHADCECHEEIEISPFGKDYPRE